MVINIPWVFSTHQLACSGTSEGVPAGPEGPALVAEEVVAKREREGLAPTTAAKLRWSASLLGVVAILKELHAMSGGEGLVLRSFRNPKKPISENTLNIVLRAMGYGADEMTSHGFRAMASTLLNEPGKWNPDAIERALAHGDSDTVRGAYHRGLHWAERVEMMQWRSDYLEALRDGARAPVVRRERPAVRTAQAGTGVQPF